MDAKTFEEQLLGVTRAAIANLRAHPRAARVLDGTADAALYAAYLVTAHVTVREAPTLLGAASYQLEREGSAPALASLLAEKCQEEHGHHRWQEADLEAIGLPLAGPHTPRPGPAAEVYLQTQRALITQCGATFAGTAYVLETLAVHCAGEAARNLQARCAIAGLSKNSWRGLTFLSAHHAADVEHTAQLIQVLSSVSDPRHRAFVLLGAQLTATLYPEFFAAP